VKSTIARGVISSRQQ